MVVGGEVPRSSPMQATKSRLRRVARKPRETDILVLAWEFLYVITLNAHSNCMRWVFYCLFCAESELKSPKA